MRILRSLLFYIGQYGALVIHASICIIVGLFIPLSWRYRYFLLWNLFSIWWLRICCGVRWQVAGIENVPPGSFVIVSNHQSPWETLFLVWKFIPICPILKKELLSIPFFGWGLRLLDPIAIDRSKKGRSLNQLLSQGGKKLAEGTSVLVFPEGTRVDPGVKKKFSAGGAELAKASGKLVLPIAHNAGHFWPAHKMIKNPGTIQVAIGKPIDPAGRDPREVTREAEEWIRQAVTPSASSDVEV